MTTLDTNMTTSKPLDDLPKRMTKAQIEELVFLICSDNYLTVNQIASAVVRNTRYLTNKILFPMLAKGKLVRLYPETPNHPNQAYKANSNPETTKE
jgi:hypothetical protein